MTTRIQDVIQPEIFTKYVQERTMELSALVQSGIIENNSEFNSLASGPNTLVNMPYWEDLTGESENMTDTGDITPAKIMTNADMAKKFARVKSWGANGLSALLSGDDPMRAIADRVADFWQRDDQRILLATLNGVFTSASMKEKVYDITKETADGALISGSSLIDAIQVMGDAKESITGIMMHSAVEAYLAKRELIEYVQEAGQGTRIPYYMNKRVIVDDAMAFNTATKEAEAYLFGTGAIAKGNGTHGRIMPTETYRNSASSSGEDFLVNRRIQILHPRGIKWTDSSVADVFPTNKEIATGANWQRVYEPKAVRIVNFKFKIAGNESGGVEG